MSNYTGKVFTFRITGSFFGDDPNGSDPEVQLDRIIFYRHRDGELMREVRVRLQKIILGEMGYSGKIPCEREGMTSVETGTFRIVFDEVNDVGISDIELI